MERFLINNHWKSQCGGDSGNQPILSIGAACWLITQKNNIQKKKHVSLRLLKSPTSNHGPRGKHCSLEPVATVKPPAEGRSEWPHPTSDKKLSLEGSNSANDYIEQVLGQFHTHCKHLQNQFAVEPWAKAPLVPHQQSVPSQPRCTAATRAPVPQSLSSRYYNWPGVKPCPPMDHEKVETS
jgi:hypothetical protein